MAWTSIPASVYAVGKPITSVSYGYLKDNGDYLKALFDAATGHKHTGAADDAPQIPQGGIATSAIGQGQLKWGSGSFTTGSSSAAFTVNRYSHSAALRAYSYSGSYPNYATLTRISSTANNSDTGRQERHILDNSDNTGANEATAYWDYHIT